MTELDPSTVTDPTDSDDGCPGCGALETVCSPICFPVDQVVQFDATVWWCRICGREGTARTTPQATEDAIAHLGIDHGGTPSP